MSRVAYIIRQLLAREGKVFLPHFGVLTLQRDASVIDSDKQIIKPPADSLHFMATEFILTQHLTAQLEKLPFAQRIDLDQLAEEVASYIQSGKKQDEFSIGNFAHFHRNNSGDFDFQAKNVNSVSPLGELPALQLPQSIQPQTIKEAATVGAVSDTHVKKQEKRKKRSWLLPTLLTLLILLISFGIWWFTPDLRNGGEGFSKLLVKEERVNISPSEVDSKESIDRPLIVDSTQSSDSDLFKNEPSLETISPSDTILDSNEESGDEAPADTSVENEEFEAEDNCVIVVGAFSKSYNVDRMKERLKNEGYDVFTQDANGLTRVGLYASCVNEKLDSVLRVARNDIEEASWILE